MPTHFGNEVAVVYVVLGDTVSVTYNEEIMRLKHTRYEKGSCIYPWVSLVATW